MLGLNDHIPLKGRNERSVTFQGMNAAALFTGQSLDELSADNTADSLVSPMRHSMSSTPKETTTRSPSIASPAANSMPLGASFIGEDTANNLPRESTRYH